MNGISRINGVSIQQDETLRKNLRENNKANASQSANLADRFEKTGTTDVITYSSKSAQQSSQSRVSQRTESDQRILDEAIALSEETLSRFREMITRMLQNQARKAEGKTPVASGINLADLGVPSAAAKEIERLAGIYGPVEWTGAVGEGDYWGVDATAQRIFDFAVSLSGGSSEKLQTLKDAIHQAFKECEQLFGGRLPDISYQTRNKINSLFEEYGKQNGSKI